jgi:hypothetical protein
MECNVYGLTRERCEKCVCSTVGRWDGCVDDANNGFGWAHEGAGDPELIFLPFR